MNDNPYSSPQSTDVDVSVDTLRRNHHGPAFYIAGGCFLGILLAVGVVNLAHHQDLRFPVILICLCGMPIGGLIYRIRSRDWPSDHSARNRTIRYSLYSLALPMCVGMLTGMQGQGLAMTLLGGLIAASFVVGVLLAGARRGIAG